MSRILILALMLFVPTFAHAALDPELKSEYVVKISIRFGDHPLFTDDFRREFTRDVQGQMQLMLGATGKVEAADITTKSRDQYSPLETLVADKGLIALDSYNKITNIKSHFVYVDFVDGRYEIQSRQHDGLTGLSSPLVRKQQSFERSLVSRMVVLTLAQDFGFIGTVEEGSFSAEDNSIKLKVKGGGFGLPPTRFVRKGDVFVLSQIRQITRRTPPGDDKGPTTEVVGNRMNEVYLHVLDEPKGDTLRCKLIQRYVGNPMPRHSSIQGYRAMKLGTIETKVRLQVVDTQGRPVTLPNLRVRVFDAGFEENIAASDRNEATKVDGVWESKTPLNAIGFVKVQVGPEVRAQIPIPLLDDRIIVTPVRMEENADKKARLLLAREDFLRRLTDSRLVQIRIFRDLSAREKLGDNRGAMKLAETTVPLLESDVQSFTEELQALQTRFEKESPDVSSPLAVTERELQKFQLGITDLKKHVDELKVAIEGENDPTITDQIKQLNAKTRQADLLVRSADYDKAISLYDEILEMKDQPMVRAKRDKLAAAWKIADGDTDHESARKYVYSTLPTMTTLMDLKDALPEAKKMIAKLRMVNDKLTLTKAELVLRGLLNGLEKEIDPLINPMDEDQRKALESAQMIAKETNELWESVVGVLKQNAEPMP